MVEPRGGQSIHEQPRGWDRLMAGAEMSASKYLTVEQALAELNAGIPPDEQIARSTWQRWRATGKGPKVIRLPNSKLRIRRSDFEAWLASLEDAPA